MQIAAGREPTLAFPFPVVSKAVSAANPARLPGRPLRLQRGEAVYAEGTVARDLYKVVSGCIRTYRILPDGRRMVASFALPDEVFGVDGSGAHRYSAEAINQAVVIAFARRAIEACVDREPVAAHCWQAFTLEKLSASEDRCLLLSRKSATERVASFLVDLERRASQGGGLIDLPMSRYDIADHLGLTAETVSRVLSCFRRRRILAGEGAHRVRLIDRDALESLAFDGSLEPRSNAKGVGPDLDDRPRDEEPEQGRSVGPRRLPSGRASPAFQRLACATEHGSESPRRNPGSR